MDFKDYYEILGVPPDAEKKVIQQTFRQLARKFHPDVNPGIKKQKRNSRRSMKLTRFYRMRKSARSMMSCGHNTNNGSRRAVANRISTGKTGRPNLAKGVHVQYANPEDLEDLFGSESPYSDFFNNIFGQARRSGRGSGRAATPSPRRGRDVEYEVDLTLEEAFHGAERLLEIDGHRIQASIPPGVRTGSRVRLAGQGEPGHNSGPAGDLYLVINVLPNDTFEREGDDLHIDVPVDIFTAIAGGEIRIPSLERPLILKIPPRTNAGRSFRLRGKGMPHLGDPKTHGDLFALVRLVLPDPLTDQEVNSIRELASSRPNLA